MNDGEKARIVLDEFAKTNRISDSDLNFILQWYDNLISFFDHRDQTIGFALILRKQSFKDIKFAREHF